MLLMEAQLVALPAAWATAATDQRPTLDFSHRQLRGGSSNSNEYDSPQTFEGYSDMTSSPNESWEYHTDQPYFDNEPPPEMDRESVQERIDKWREEQYALQSAPPDQQQSPAQLARMRLLISVAKPSRVLIFLVLMWRIIHLYEVADQTFRVSAKGLATGIFRNLFVRGPLTFLFVANLAGVVVTFTSAPGHHVTSKRRLKAILNLDKLLEILLIVQALARLSIFPGNPRTTPPRDVYINNVIYSLFFLLQTHGFTRLNWDEGVAPTMMQQAEGMVQRRQQYLAEQRPSDDTQPTI
jgi:hypothetical protein